MSPDGLRTVTKRGRWTMGSALLPLPPGEVPQCAHWGGEGMHHTNPLSQIACGGCDLPALPKGEPGAPLHPRSIEKHSLPGGRLRNKRNKYNMYQIAFFSSATSLFSEVTTVFKNASSSSSASTRLFGASVSKSVSCPSASILNCGTIFVSYRTSI